MFLLTCSTQPTFPERYADELSTFTGKHFKLDMNFCNENKKQNKIISYSFRVCKGVLVWSIAISYYQYYFVTLVNIVQKLVTKGKYLY